MDSQFSHLAWCQTGAHVLCLRLQLQSQFCVRARDYAPPKKNSSYRLYYTPCSPLKLLGLLMHKIHTSR